MKPLATIHGEPVQAVYGFCRMIKKLLDTFKPHYIALVWDSKGKTVRHEMYPEYKATRQEAPSDLFIQKQRIQTFADLIGMAQIQQTGIEADDLMYSVAREMQDHDFKTIIVTSDKDMSQTLNDHTFIFDPFKDATIDTAAFETKMGFPVSKLPFYFSLIGDASDNIPGVKGIGPKGATDLVQQFASLDDLYANIRQVKKERVRTLLETHKVDALMSLKLFLLQYVPLHTSTESLKFDPLNWANALPFFEELNFKSLVRDVQTDIPLASSLDKKIPLSIEKGYKFITVTTKEQLDELAALIRSKRLFATDTEGSGLMPLQGQVCGFSVCIHEGTSYYIPYGHKTEETQLSKEDVFAVFKPIFQDETIKKILHHAKFDILALWHEGIEVKGLVFDTLIAASLTAKDGQRIGLKFLSHQFFNEPMLNFQEVVTGNGYEDFTHVPLGLATEYGAADSHQTLKLVAPLERELQQNQMEKLYHEIELPLVTILTDMEKEGIELDTKVIAELNVHATRDLQRLRTEIVALIGEEFKDINLNSPKQLEALLFEHLKLPTQKKTGAKTGYSTDQEVLEILADMHPVPGLISLYRELFKLKSTYIDALPLSINPQTNRIHTTFSQTGVATGRLASYEPNLQNIPTDSQTYPHIQIRRAFIPPKGHVFLSADYSQIELRILAEFSRDENLMNAFLEGVDIHQRTAANIFDVPLNQVTNQQRQVGKRINFSILYGLTPYGLSKDLKISMSDAKKYIDKYFAQYPKVSQWMEFVELETKAKGYTQTYWGRRRYLPGIHERNKTLHDLARRMAINTPVQGTASEIMKLGMIHVNEALKNHQLNAKMIVQIHDELLLTVPENELERTRELVKETLERVVHWKIPLVVSTRSGLNWYEVTK